jgi:hypothetical protein
MTDEELISFCSDEVGMVLEDEDLIRRGNKVVGCKRSRLFTRLMRFAYDVQPL